MKTRTKTKISAGAAALILAGAFGLSQKRVHARAEVDPDPSGSSSLPVAAFAVATREPLADSYSVTGEFIPYQEVELHAKVAGYVRKIYVDIGDHVRAGQVLAVLEVPELNAQVEGANAGVRHSNQEISRAQNDVARAQANHAALHAAAVRIQQASQARPGLIAEQELDDAQAKDRAAEAQVESAKSMLAAARQQLDVSKASASQVSAMQDYSKIVAPFDGVITWRYADTGSLIQAGTSNNNSMPVVKLAQSQLLRLRIPVPESFAAAVHVGDTADIAVQATAEHFPGRVARFTDSLDRTTRSMQVEIDVPNHNYHLAPGMYADVTLRYENQPHALGIPVQALMREGSQERVWLIGPGNEIVARDIKTGIETPNTIEVLSGLQAGDRVLVGNLASFQPGEKVAPKLTSLTAFSTVEGKD
ncbi:MAG: efflux RND transporter periplasmic adaptor subunit [Acidobacteriaceae bacterium]